MNYERLCTAVDVLSWVCDEWNQQSHEGVEYVVLQGVEKDDFYRKDPFLAHKITEFYNKNWLGNQDFMHIPDFFQVKHNCSSFPVLIARDKKTKEIVGISTLKYFDNEEEIDPYYPFPHEKYFSITGILTKRNSPYRGVGKTIYELLIIGYHFFHKRYPDTSLTCVIDCRNKNSMNAIDDATKDLSNHSSLKYHSSIVGFYTVEDDDKNLVEAPTIVLKVMSGKHSSNRETLEYSNQKRNLFSSLLDTLKSYLEEDSILDPIMNQDSNLFVSYYPISKYKNSLPIVISNGTEKGNDRVPVSYTEIQGPYRLPYIKTRREDIPYAG